MDAAKVADAFVGAVVQKLVDYLASQEVFNFFRVRKLDESLLKKLKVTMLALNEVLNDAENKQFIKPDVKDWLNELKDAIYDAEDLVDEIATEALRCKVEAEYPREQKRFRDSPILPWNWLHGHGMNSKLEESGGLNSKLEEMIGILDHFVKTKDALGLREVAGQNWSQTRLSTTSLVDESCVYGRENDKEEIMKLLLSDGESSEGIDVIPIVGMGGVGKTTLAQLLYNDGTLKDHFGMKSWVCVSDVFDVERVTRTIVKAVTGCTSEADDLNSLQVKLKESLCAKKFLIVLDDVWNENYEHWDMLMTPFKFGARGSKIIVTTRNERVASIVQTVPIHALQKLSEDDCWKLFSKLAFENGDCNAHPNLETIGKQIAKKCKGSPLAAKTLGGLLRSQRDIKDWNKILESSIWELPEERSKILPALRLSYHYLPSHLKKSFAYCSIFNKDYEFDKKKLVSIWMAEGFLKKPKNNKTVEEEGFECFDELLSRSFFKKSNANDSFFVMHDLVHDLAQSVAGDFCYMLEEVKPQGISEKVRHFSYAQATFDGFDKFKLIKDAKCLRTFLPIDHHRTSLRIHHRLYYRKWLSKKVLEEILTGLTRLRLLSLLGYRIKELPNSIGNLIHLRFLDLSRTLIDQLPKSVCTLYNLETLLLSNCRLLTTLPEELVKLISLRHLDLSGTNLKEMPKHISRLKGLQHLTAFVVGKCSGSCINELKELCLCGTIFISSLQNVTSGSDALEAKMREKKHLEKLALEWDSTMGDSQNESDVLEKLEPHTNLKHLHIKNYRGTRFPTWLGDQSFCNMVSLCLENCDNCISLPPLGQLSFLKELTISRMSGIKKVDHGFYGRSGSSSKQFESLETLRFQEMSELVDWCILDAGEFSRLKILNIIDCPKLIGHLPKEMPSLVRLNIEKCPKLVSSLPRTTSIRELKLNECQGMQLEWQGVSSVEKLVISEFASLQEFSSEQLTLTNLKELRISNCPRLLSFPDGMPINNLKYLNVDMCPELVLSLSEEMIHQYASLEKIHFSSCWSLKSLPLGLFPKLRYLAIVSCDNFENLLIPDGIEFQNLTLLETLDIICCDNMVSLSCGGLPAANLSSVRFHYCKKLKALPEQMQRLFPSLTPLALKYCPEIESFPEGGLPSTLIAIDIENCEKLVAGRRDWGLRTHPSLTSFNLRGGSEGLESFPEEGLLPSTLTFIRTMDLPNLKSLNKRGFQLLGSLKRMEIWNCPQLQSLPEDGFPTSFSWLRIERCPLLKPRCRRDEGEDWHKIAHIPSILIDGEVISD